MAFKKSILSNRKGWIFEAVYAPATLRLLTSTEGEPMGEASNSRSPPTSVISLSSC